MTLASSIIKSAYRESNLISSAASTTAAQETEALALLDTLIRSTIGNEAGNNLTDLNIGGTYDESSLTSTWIPDDVRLVLNLSSASTVYLDPYPRDGQRLSFVDTGQNLATYSLTLNGNGRTIEGTSSLVLTTNGDSRDWMYRADTGNWFKTTTLIDADDMPFPAEFDDYFITMLALRLNPRFSQVMADETKAAMGRAKSQLRARYNKPREVFSDVNTRGGLADPRNSSTPTDTEFKTGRPFSYL